MEISLEISFSRKKGSTSASTINYSKPPLYKLLMFPPLIASDSLSLDLRGLCGSSCAVSRWTVCHHRWLHRVRTLYLDSLVSPATVCLLCFSSSENCLFPPSFSSSSSSPSTPHEILLSFLSSSNDLDLSYVCLCVHVFACVWVEESEHAEGHKHATASGVQEKERQTVISMHFSDIWV